ncbi:hypothetical protein CO180_02155 [candidate division WWE3 bacterium CG_4_9_14_3_um_filter_41_6]|uniref:Uncharacterized protein n=1 Tax=candidate division WWE3 bacterium CG_4_10_14_0_2_um_filter_41_14 TaxID=1975072 RepID=A0A2M7TJY7_UNCKA|nr:MAG: hypothetical protein COY32_02425 [candidate division WWE3 bacterium CG_4_10_14_0_2_um_filter_41_14]PJA38873.1 MAG: hypothetical protein CO180_02155 [candidate division WWE3 bacterium CG_4_9_14_3_um_filter_41_6]
MDELTNRVTALEERNRRVELNKSWETSTTRKFFVALFTYLSIVLYFLVIDVERPFINAVVPTAGFLLSTLSLPYIRIVWERMVKK